MFFFLSSRLFRRERIEKIIERNWQECHFFFEIGVVCAVFVVRFRFISSEQFHMIEILKGFRVVKSSSRRENDRDMETAKNTYFFFFCFSSLSLSNVCNILVDFFFFIPLYFFWLLLGSLRLDVERIVEGHLTKVSLQILRWSF